MDGRNYHASWGNHAEELIFRTSRYYAYTEDFLRRTSGVNDFSFGDYRAQSVTPEQRATMARLLRRAAGRVTGRAVIALISRIQESGKQARLPSRPRSRSRPLESNLGARPPHPRLKVRAEDPFLNLANRFGIRVRRQGRHLWVPYPTLKALLDAPHPRLRQSVRNAIEQLHDGGFHLHGSRGVLRRE